jgi:predicted ester cyclase
VSGSEENKEIVRRVEEVWASGDLDALDTYFSSDFDNSESGVPGLPAGLEGAKIAHRMSMESFPDRVLHIDDLIAEGDRVVVRGHVTGTNQGGVLWVGAEANGNPIDVMFISIYRLADGLIVQHWAQNDTMGLMQQLGAMPG